MRSEYFYPTIINNGDPWFVAKDLCDVLDIKASKDAVARLDEDEKARFKIATSGGPQEMYIVNESGMNSLVLSSRKPEAKAFKKFTNKIAKPSVHSLSVAIVSAMQ